MWILWVSFFCLIFVFLALDLGIFNRKEHVIRFREAMGWSLFWIFLGLSFSGIIYLVYEYHWLNAALAPKQGQILSGGAQAVVQYLTAYILEKSLSIDNLFVMSLIFTSFKIPAQNRHRVLYWGIIGAIIFRLIFIFGGVWLISSFEWVFYIFGAYLIYAGAKMIMPGKSENPEDMFILRMLKKFIPISGQSPHGHFFAKIDGKTTVTTLFTALAAIELSDIVFAVDSIPAVLAISNDPFIVATSNIFAILGLRSLYFVLADMIDRFIYLKFAMAFVLVLIGIKLFLHHLVEIPNLISLAAVALVVSSGIFASILFGKKGMSE